MMRELSMTAGEALVSLARERGIEIWLGNDHRTLQYRGPQEFMTPEWHAAVYACKREVMAAMGAPVPSAPPRDTPEGVVVEWLRILGAVMIGGALQDTDWGPPVVEIVAPF